MQTNDLEINDLLKARRYDPTKRPSQEQVVFSINSKIVGTLQNYVVVSGLPKASKSTYVGAIAASALVPHYQAVFGLKLSLPADRQRLAYFDTEHSAFDFYRQMDKIKGFADKNSLPNFFDAFSTREDMPAKIRKLVEAYLQAHAECSVLIIDGLLDLCLNYNDERETRLLTNWFKRITKQYNVLLIGVLHLGKGQGETLGHLGSNTDRWAQSTLIVERNKENQQFILRPKYLRSSDDFDPIAIMNFNGLWQQVPYIEQETFTIPKKGKKS
jgi:hypothetical protein